MGRVDNYIFKLKVKLVFDPFLKQVNKLKPALIPFKLNYLKYQTIEPLNYLNVFIYAGWT